MCAGTLVNVAIPNAHHCAFTDVKYLEESHIFSKISVKNVMYVKYVHVSKWSTPYLPVGLCGLVQ